MDYQRLKEQLTLHEGWRDVPYGDTTGHLTIGVGHNLAARGLDPQVIDLQLELDIARVIADLDRVFPWWHQLDEVRQRVLIDMGFNLGVGKLRAFSRTMAAIKAHRFEDASVFMLESLWAEQVGARARTLAEMMRTGQDLPKITTIKTR